MNKQDVIKELKQYFSIEELVGPKEYKRDGEMCWRYLQTELLHTILIVRRDILKVPMSVNNWKNGGSFDERGYRSNVSDIFKSKTISGSLYVSGHVLGCAIDFDAKGFTTEQTRQKIIDNKNLLPYPIRLESKVNWIHIDTYDPIINNNKITIF